MKIEDIDFQKELDINKYKLDEECLSHATRYAYWADAYVEAKNEYGIRKDNLALTIAEKSIDLRNYYMESGEKFTEARLDAAIAVEDDVVIAKQKLREAEELMNKLDVAVKSMDTRRSELDNLVKLYCAGYFSNVSTNPTKRDVNEEVSREMRKNLNKGEEVYDEEEI